MPEDPLVTYGQLLYDAVLDTVGDGITVIDRDLTILFQNQTISKAYGSRLGIHCYSAYRGRQEPCEGCIVLEVMGDGKPRKALRDVRLPDGGVLWMEIFSGPFRGHDGEIVGAVEVVRDVTEQMRLSEECATLRREIERQSGFGDIITQSKGMKRILGLVRRVASTTSSVLITGESGTGKELIARAIVANSERRDKPFVTVNCGALPEQLLESELFGHVRGSFTGAIRDHTGLIETAQGGTLFLDEVADLPLAVQVKLLRFLQEGETRKVGATKVQKFDVRVIAATNRDLEDAVRNGAFREDLFFRLNVIPLHVPSLRDRKEDIAPLATHLLQRLCDTHSRNVTGISSDALKKLVTCDWPGNVRELENVLEYALHLTDDGQPIRVEQLPQRVSEADDMAWSPADYLSVEEYTKRCISGLQEDHTEEEIGKILGISRKNLWEKRKRWHLQRPAKT